MRSIYISFWILLFLPFFGNSQIVINEIMYNPPESGVDSLEFIELHNAGNSPVNLDGYTFTQGLMHEFSSVEVQADGYLVIAVNSEAIQNVFGITVVQWMDGALNNGGEVIELRDGLGNLIDMVEYSPGGGWPSEADGGGSSLELCDPESDNSDPSNWQASTFGTGNFINGYEVQASPGQQNCQIDVDQVVEVKNNVFDPPDITIFVGETVEWQAIEGTHNVNGSLAQYPANPEGFYSGTAAPAPWTFQHTFHTSGTYNYHCDPHLALGMSGTITVQSLDQLYPLYTISEVKGVDQDGIADSLDVLCTLEGIVHSINFHPPGYSFALIDDSGTGINVFSTSPVSEYEVESGDELSIRGRIDQFNGLIEFRPDDIEVLSFGNDLLEPEVVTTELDEETESKLIQIRDVSLDDPAQWIGDGSSFNVEVSNNNATYLLRVDSDTEVSELPPPSGAFHVTGIGSQYDTEIPYFQGYQIFPRTADDIELVSSTSAVRFPVLELFPNPTDEFIYFDSKDLGAGEYRIYNILGDEVGSGNMKKSRRLYVGSLDEGMYYLILKIGQHWYRSSFVKL